MPPRRRNGGLSQAEVMRQLDVDASVIFVARRQGILRGVEAPSGEIYYPLLDVRRLSEELADVRRAVRAASQEMAASVSKVRPGRRGLVGIERAMNHRVHLDSGLDLYICESCGHAVTDDARCHGCNPTSRL